VPSRRLVQPLTNPYRKSGIASGRLPRGSRELDHLVGAHRAAFETKNGIDVPDQSPTDRVKDFVPGSVTHPFRFGELNQGQRDGPPSPACDHARTVPAPLDSSSDSSQRFWRSHRLCQTDTARPRGSAKDDGRVQSWQGYRKMFILSGAYRLFSLRG
jgi:hypothetical protein